jgi:hypothetical protein
MSTTSEIDWSGYKSLPRAEKARRMCSINDLIWDRYHALPGQWSPEQYAAEKADWIFLFRQLSLNAAEIAEAILLADPRFGNYDRPPGNATTDCTCECDEIINRAMSMATQWHDDCYQDCLGMYEVGHTFFGGMREMRATLAEAGYPEAEADAIEAGAAAAKFGSDAMTFFIFTEPDFKSVAG